MFNLAIIQQKLSKQVMQDERSQLRVVQNAFYDLKAASRTFTWLHAATSAATTVVSTEAERLREFKCDFEREARVCEDLLAQGKHHLARAEKLDEAEREMKRRQEADVMELRARQEQELRKREEEIEQQRLAQIEKRAQYLRKTENQAMSIATNIEKGAAKKRSKRDTGEILSSGSERDNEGGQDGGEARPVKSKATSKSAAKKKRRTNDSDVESEKSESESEEEEEEAQASGQDEEEEAKMTGDEDGEPGKESSSKHRSSSSKKSKSKKRSKSSRM
jgi:hypothetical protein